MNRIFLLIGGVFNGLLVIFHLSFWKTFNWPESLRTLSDDNQAIMQVLNVHAVYVLALFTLLSFVFPRDLLSTRIGRVLCAGIAVFYYLRAVNQMVFWGTAAESGVATIVCVIIALLYTLPLMQRAEQPAR